MFFKLLLAIVFLLAAGCAHHPVVSGVGVNRDKLEEIKKGVARLRGLPFKADVAVEIKNRAEIRRYLESDLAHDYSEEKLRNMAVAYAKLGLLPKGVDLKKSLLDFTAAEVVAFYDPRSKKLVMPRSPVAEVVGGSAQVPARGDGRDVMGEMVLAHELTHALQDQHFSLLSKLGPSDNDDRDLAFRALVEGDATLSGYDYASGGLGREALAQLGRGIQEGVGDERSRYPEVPPAIVEEMLFRYYGGVEFVSRLLAERGWTAVNHLYAAPPLSTEQVIHPEKYFAAPDPPTKIELGDLAALFAPDWKEIENNVLGELMVRVLLKQFLSEEEAKSVAEGWDGDRFVAFSRGDEVAFIWASVWDSERDAEEFVRGFERLLARKYSGDLPAGAFYTERRSRQVIVVEGVEKGRVRERIEKIWQGMRATEEPFKSPFAPTSRLLPTAAERISP